MGPEGIVKIFRSSNIGTQVKQVRHGNHKKIEIYGVWWCQDEPSAKAIKSRLDGFLKDTYEPAEGAGFYHMAVPKQMAQVAVELAAGETGVIIFSNDQREEWLLHQVKKRAAKPPRGF